MESREQQPSSNEAETSVDLDDKEKYSAETLAGLLEVKMDTQEYWMSKIEYKNRFEEGRSLAVFITKNFDVWISGDYHAAAIAQNGIDYNDTVFVGRIYKENKKIGWFNPDFYASLADESDFANFYKELGRDKTLEIIANKIEEALE